MGVTEQLYEQQQADRRRRNEAIARINTFFNGEPARAAVVNPFTHEVMVPATTDTRGLRDQVYRKIAADTTNFQTLDLNEQNQKNNQELTYQLARTGNLRSSTDIHQRSELRRLYRKGLLDASNIGLTAADRARAGDENARLQAIQSVNADVDTGSAINAAQSQIASNAASAADYGKGQSVGNVFNNLTYLYGQYQNGQGAQRAVNAYNNGSGFGPSVTGTGRSNYGTVT